MKKLTIVLGAAVSLALAAPALAQAQTVIKFSHVVAPDTPKGKGSLKFKELAEKYTNGKVKVEVYPNSQLYKDNEELQALQLGAVQMLAPSLAKFGPLGVKEFEVFDLPYILPDKAALRKVTDGALGKKLMGLLEPKGITGLAYWDNGFKDMSANKKLLMPADFRGLKMRIQSSKVLEAQMRALGAIPQVMAFSEVYQALATGVVDGTENPPSNEYTQKMHEVQKYTTRSEHGYVGYAVIANKKFWDGLPADIRASLEKAMAEATDIRQRRRAEGQRRGGRGDEEIRQDRDGRADRRAEGGMAQGAGAGLHRDGSPRRQGNYGRVQEGSGRRRHALTKSRISPLHGNDGATFNCTNVGEGSVFLRILDRLEEMLIASLMAAATLLIFVAVVHRYGTGVPFLYPFLIQIHLSWAQELCIYMFVWMAKFGAAYGVRTGIHVGVDVLVNQLEPDLRQQVVLFSLFCGALFTAVVGTMGLKFVIELYDTDQVSADLEAPRWIVFSAVPARLLPDVLPFPAGGLVVLLDRRICRTMTRAASRASRSTRRPCIRPMRRRSGGAR